MSQVMHRVFYTLQTFLLFWGTGVLPSSCRSSSAEHDSQLCASLFRCGLGHDGVHAFDQALVAC